MLYVRLSPEPLRPLLQRWRANLLRITVVKPRGGIETLVLTGDGLLDGNRNRPRFILQLFSHPIFIALKVLFRMPAYGENYQRISTILRTIADLVLEDYFSKFSVFRNFLIGCCSVVSRRAGQF
jgi:hypothetical protein